MPSDIYKTIQEATRRYGVDGPRSNEKLKVLHGDIADIILDGLPDNITAISVSDTNKSEFSYSGEFMDKNTDISLFKDGNIHSIISVKQVMSNYLQNANNYFENMVGEAVNSVDPDINFYYLMFIADKVPYFKDKGDISKWETFKDSSVDRFGKFSSSTLLANITPEAIGIMTYESHPSTYTAINRKNWIDLCSRNPEVTESSRPGRCIGNNNVYFNQWENFINHVRNGIS